MVVGVGALEFLKEGNDGLMVIERLLLVKSTLNTL
jgi:hypothetical protein